MVTTNKPWFFNKYCDEFIEDSNQRLALYREISEIDNVEKLRTTQSHLKINMVIYH